MSDGDTPFPVVPRGKNRGNNAMMAATMMNALFDAIDQLAKLHGGLGPWFEEFEARSIKNAKNNRVDGLAMTHEADALQFGTDAITWVFATARERIKQRYPS